MFKPDRRQNYLNKKSESNIQNKTFKFPGNQNPLSN
jgi:hypothetical protein